MINLTVTTFNDRPVANLSASFDELGGTIGRSKTNQLVLPDPDRVVSRVHAKIVFRAGAYSLQACGANPLRHNNAVLKPGAEVMLSVGDRIQIEGYTITVTPAHSSEAADPFAALFDREEQGAAGSVAPPPISVAKPMQGVIGSPAAGAPSPPAKGGIPEDWDPFERSSASQNITPQPGAPGAQMSPATRDLPVPAPQDSIDSLFGLQEQSGDELDRALGSPAAQPNTANHPDPLRSLESPPKLGAMPVPDHVPDINSPWVNRMANDALAKTVAIPKGAVLSWKADAANANRPGPPQALKPAATVVAAALPERTPEAGPRSPPGADVAGEKALTAPRQSASTASVDALVAGLIEGLQMPGFRIERLTPELMKELGQLLREATKGTVELLAIRAALKREIRADVTIINANENNPLKFSPDVNGAMQHLFGQRMRGFMSPTEAMRDAFQDLRAHELGIMAGMKAALAGVLMRFDPQVLEGKLTGSTSLMDLIPSPRKARLWNQFEALYRQLADEAEADFNTVFGKAFLEAYEGYVEQIDKATGKD